MPKLVWPCPAIREGRRTGCRIPLTDWIFLQELRIDFELWRLCSTELDWLVFRRTSFWFYRKMLRFLQMSLNRCFLYEYLLGVDLLDVFCTYVIGLFSLPSCWECLRVCMSTAWSMLGFISADYRSSLNWNFLKSSVLLRNFLMSTGFWVLLNWFSICEGLISLILRNLDF